MILPPLPKSTFKSIRILLFMSKTEPYPIYK